MRCIVLLLCLMTAVTNVSSQEPPLEEVLKDLGLVLNPSDEIAGHGATQGTFIQVADKVELILVAKHSFQKQETVSNVQAGYYYFGEPDELNLLFECGSEAGDETDATGLPAEPRGKIDIDPGFKPIGFYVQSANFNPEFSVEGETVYTQNRLNERIERFEHSHKALIYPYKTKYGVRENWYVICWEFSTNDDYQDLVTVVRGVEMIIPPQPKDHYDVDQTDTKRTAKN